MARPKSPIPFLEFEAGREDKRGSTPSPGGR